MKHVEHCGIRRSAFALLLCLVLLFGVLIVPGLTSGTHNNVAQAQTSAEFDQYIKIDYSDETLIESQKTADFIKNNLQEFVAHYNNSVDSSHSNATSVEHEAIVYLTFKKAYAYYLDFDADNGYLIIDSDYSLQEFEVNGDLPYLKDIGYTFYNALDKFLYYDYEKSTYVPYEAFEYDESTLIAGLSAGADVAFDGQHPEANGEGQIYNLNAYVAQNYSKYNRQSIQIIPNYNWIYQYDTSIFKHVKTDSNGNTSNWSEGNCVINATYSMMKDWKDQGYYTNLDSNTVDYRTEVLSNPQYAKYGTNTYDGWTLNSSNYLERMPKLYLELREQAVNRGYLPESGMYSSHIPAMVNVVGKNYGYNFNMNSSSAHNAIVGSMNAHRAGVLSVQNSQSYGNHAMGLYGFVVYHYQSGWWIFKKDHYAYFYLIDDGWGYKQNDTNFATQYSGVIPGMDGLGYNLCYYDANKSNSKTFYYLSNYNNA